jgi:hypothetical protein
MIMEGSSLRQRVGLFVLEDWALQEISKNCGMIEQNTVKGGFLPSLIMKI